jgi:polar amino acid transport system substrate-binding protein
VIRQAMGIAKQRGTAAAMYITEFVDVAIKSDFVAASLARHKISGATIPPATSSS